MHHPIVVAIGHERGLRDGGQAVKPRGLGDAPGCNRGELGVAGCEVGRGVAVLFPLVGPPEVLRAPGAALLRRRENRLSKSSAVG